VRYLFDTILGLVKNKNDARLLGSKSKQNLWSCIWKQSALLQCKHLRGPSGTWQVPAKNTTYRLTWQFKKQGLVSEQKHQGDPSFQSLKNVQHL
jgi:hypothetical protein